ncbi:MAG TPA: ATP-binding protein [Tepidisphaeraceae bacterium]|jgi:two-component system CheB/CheR fusion protein|nr:ATP-binding protein [Tepidisphaeraceae bacterium]
MTNLGNAEIGMQGDVAAVDAASIDVTGILDTIDVPIVVIGRDCKVVSFNRAAVEALGVTPSDIGRNICDIQALAGVPDIDQLCVQVMVDEEPSRRDIRSGDRWFLLRIAPYTGTDRQARGTVLTFTNVTAFRASLGQAIYEREYTKTILNAMIDPLVVLDGGLQVQTANRAFYEWFGLSREHTQGIPLNSLGDGDWKACGLWSSLKATLSGNGEFQTIEFEGDFPSVGRRTILLDARRIARDGNPLLLLAFRDITQRKRAEQKLRDSERRFREMTDSLPTAIYTTDAQGRLTHFNPACIELSGRMPALGSDHWCVTWKLYHPDGTPMPHDECPMAVALKEGRIVRGSEAIAERPDGTRIWFIAYPTPLRDPEGHIVGGINMLVDITARKNLERQRELLLAQEEALRMDAEAAGRAKDGFLAVLSHELRTPLSPVMMTIAAMENNPDLPLALREDVAMIRRNIELETRLIDDLLDLNRVTSGKMRLQVQPTHVHLALTQAMQNCASETLAKKLNVRLDLQADTDLVNADPARLQQVFWNLLRNAAKFTPEGGNIFIRTVRTGGKVIIEVRDTGAGITREFLPKIFDAFEQGDMGTARQFGGLGLGLAICKAIMDMHGGAIHAQSDGPGTGATFTVELPAVSATDREALAMQSPDHNHTTGHLRILLVEDHPDTREVLARLLRASSFAVKTAASVEAALQLAAMEAFDIVVSDLGLPDGTGYDLMKQIRDRHGIKGIALSGYGMEEDLRRSREAGFLDHIVKPVNVSQLVAVLQRAVGSQISG